MRDIQHHSTQHWDKPDMIPACFNKLEAEPPQKKTLTERSTDQQHNEDDFKPITSLDKESTLKLCCRYLKNGNSRVKRSNFAHFGIQCYIVKDENLQYSITTCIVSSTDTTADNDNT